MFQELRINMEIQEVTQVVKDKKNQSNKIILESLEFLSDRHEKIKQAIINLTYELDEVESNYNKLLEEYTSRKKL